MLFRPSSRSRKQIWLGCGGYVSWAVGMACPIVSGVFGCFPWPLPRARSVVRWSQLGSVMFCSTLSETWTLAKPCAPRVWVLVSTGRGCGCSIC
jgi:hypothetical protein